MRTGRFEIAGVSREVIEAFSTRRAEIEASMRERGLGDPAANQRIAERAALMSRAHKRDVDKAALGEHWAKQAADLGFDAKTLAAAAREREAGREAGDGTAPPSGQRTDAEPAKESDAERSVVWAVAHLSEREAVFSRTDLLAAAIARQPGEIAIGEAEAAVSNLLEAGRLHAANLPEPGESLTTDKAIADEKETVALMKRGQGASRPLMRSWRLGPRLHRGRLTEGQKEAVKLILSSKDRIVGVQGYAGSGKTTMLDRAREARREKRLSRHRTGAVGIGRENARRRGGDRERDAATVSGPACRCRRGPTHEEG